MQASVSPRTVQNRGLQVVENDLTHNAAKEFQRMDEATVKLRLALGEAEFDVAQAAVTQHRHEDRDAPNRGADFHAPAGSPIHLHGLSRFVKHLLIDALAEGPDLPQAAAHHGD